MARLLCRLATVVFQHEQPERRREITVLAVLIDATEQRRRRDAAVASDLLQRGPELLLKTYTLRPASKIERLTISDFMRSPASYVIAPCPAPMELGNMAPWLTTPTPLTAGTRRPART